MTRSSLDYSVSERAEQIVGLRHPRPGDYFMERLQNKGFIVAPGVFCAGGAQDAREEREAELAAGIPCTYDAVYGSGYSIASMLWGVPDRGFHDRTMIVLIGKYIVSNAYPLPVIYDAETGFGDELTLAWTVEEYHRIGVGVAHLEDQLGKSCGNQAGKRICETDVMLAKIRAWLEHTYNLNSSMRLMVRTDALTAIDGGIDVAIDRMRRYLDVEYKGLYPVFSWADAMMKPEHIEKWCTELRRTHPHVMRALNYSPNKDWTGYYRGVLGRQDPPTYEEFYAGGQGFKLQFHTIFQERSVREVWRKTLKQMAREGAKALWDLHERQRGTPVADCHALSGFPAWQKLELRIGGDEASERYRRSEGYGSKKLDEDEK